MAQASVDPEAGAKTFGPHGRYAEIDVWRGLILCIIFINHVPGTFFERLTPKNLGFSDCAEAFVFLSGVSLALAYASRFGDGRSWQVVQSLKRRAVKLYGVHILLSLAAVAIYATGAHLGDDEMLMNVHGRDLFIDDPTAALLGLLSLGHQLGYFNILPLYIVLIAFFAGQLALLRIGVGAMVGASAATYGVARLLAWNVPTWPMKGTWFFDPLTWQLLLAVGCASVVLHRRGALPRSPRLLVLAGVVVVAGAFDLTDGLHMLPGLDDRMRQWLDLDKTSLGLGRLVHFSAVAYLLYGLKLGRFFSEGVGGLLGILGRHSLAVFAMLSMFAAIGQVVTTLAGNSIPVDCAVIGGGLALLFAAGSLLESRTTGIVLAPVSVGAKQR